MQRKPNFELSDGRLQIIFEEIPRDEFVQRAVTIEVDQARRFSRLNYMMRAWEFFVGDAVWGLGGLGGGNTVRSVKRF